jgi:hypothetical protein
LEFDHDARHYRAYQVSYPPNDGSHNHENRRSVWAVSVDDQPRIFAFAARAADTDADDLKRRIIRAVREVSGEIHAP